MFEINTAKDKLKQLIEDYEKLLKNASNVSLAEKVCGDTWHLNDWVLHEFHDKGDSITQQQFRTQLYFDCPEFKVLHDLANSFKHKKLSIPKVQIKYTEKHDGVFDSSFDSSFDISYLMVVFMNGEKRRLNEILEPSIKYWIENIK